MKLQDEIFDSGPMCEFESNILKLLLEEKERLTKVFVDADAPYMKSLDHGIKSAKEKLAQCKENVCRNEIYKQNKDIVPIYDLQKWSQMKLDLVQCSRDYN